MAKRKTWREHLREDLLVNADVHGFRTFDSDKVWAFIELQAKRKPAPDLPQKLLNHYQKALASKPKGRTQLINWLKKNWDGPVSDIDKPRKNIQRLRKEAQEELESEEQPLPLPPPPPPQTSIQSLPPPPPTTISTIQPDQNVMAVPCPPESIGDVYTDDANRHFVFPKPRLTICFSLLLTNLNPHTSSQEFVLETINEYLIQETGFDAVLTAAKPLADGWWDMQVKYYGNVTHIFDAVLRHENVQDGFVKAPEDFGQQNGSEELRDRRA